MDAISVIAAFRSRAQTMKLFQAAKQNGIPCNIVNTPREAAVSCGISVSYCPEVHAYIQRLMYRGNFSGLIGFFKITRVGGKRTLAERI
ncbi:MAG: DUF3343 domain-containing protein [Clostridiales bacterium]|jgi:hypothetical protein|nr:DUF3343 domain-containing protein [Clostridiales bacterium]